MRVLLLLAALPFVCEPVREASAPAPALMDCRVWRGELRCWSNGQPVKVTSTDGLYISRDRFSIKPDLPACFCKRTDRVGAFWSADGGSPCCPDDCRAYNGYPTCAVADAGLPQS